MKLKKSPFFHFVVLLAIILFTYSCGKKKQENVVAKKDLSAINKLLDNGHTHYLNEKLDSSYYYYNKAKNLALINRDTSRIIHSIAWMADIESMIVDYSSAEATAVSAFQFMPNNDKFPNGKRNIYNTLGNIHFYSLNNDYALYYFKKALKLKIDHVQKAGLMNNIALVYMAQKRYDAAIKILRYLSIQKLITDDSEMYSTVIDNLGYCYFQVKNPEAVAYINKAKEIRNVNKNDRGLIGSYFHLFELTKNNNPQLAFEYLKLAFEKATLVKSVDDRLECLANLIKNSNGPMCKYYSTSYLRLNDSLSKARVKVKNQFATIKYDFTKEKNENLKLRAQTIRQKEQQRNKAVLLYLVVGAIITISVVVGNFLVAKNKREKIKTSYNTEIRIAKKLHDELANDVFQTMAFAETQDLSTIENREVLLNSLETIYARTRNISRENSIVESGPNFIYSFKEMISGFNSEYVNVLVNGIDTIHWETVESNKKITLFRVVQELLINMKKHSKAGLVVLIFKETDYKLSVDYSDNGIGTTLDEKTSRNGLQNVENRIRAINGTITFVTEFNKGFKVHLSFPI